jgi:hypothetical protein
MSFRVEGQTIDEQIASIEATLRYLYKCCERSNSNTGFELLVAGQGQVDGDNSSEHWYVTVGQVRLVSFAATFIDPVTLPFTVELDIDGTPSGHTITVPVGFSSATAVIDPPVILNPGQYIQLTVIAGSEPDPRVSIFGTSAVYCPSFGGQFSEDPGGEG